MTTRLEQAATDFAAGEILTEFAAALADTRIGLSTPVVGADPGTLQTFLRRAFTAGAQHDWTVERTTRPAEPSFACAIADDLLAEFLEWPATDLPPELQALLADIDQSREVGGAIDVVPFVLRAFAVGGALAAAKCDAKAAQWDADHGSGHIVAFVCRWLASAIRGNEYQRQPGLSRQPRETQHSICEWATKELGPAGTTLRLAVQAQESLTAVLALLAYDDEHPKAAAAIASVVVALERMATRLGVNLWTEVEHFMDAWRKTTKTREPKTSPGTRPTRRCHAQ